MERTPRRDKFARKEGVTVKYIHDRHRQLFELLDPHWAFKYLSSAWSEIFIGPFDTQWKKEAWKRTQERLFDAGYLDRPHQQRWSPNSNYKHLIIERTAKAAAIVGADKHPAHRSNSYPHELLVDLGFYAPMRYAVMQDKTLKLHSAKELMTGASFRIHTAKGIETLRVPNPTRFSDDPFLIELKKAIRDERGTEITPAETMRFDGTPFMLERTMSDGTIAYIFVPGIEVDRKTESLKNIKPKDPTRTTLTKHLEQIMDFFGKKKYIQHYGFPMMMVPIITTNETHTKNAMRFVENEIGACRYMLFKTLPDLAMEPHFPTPSGDFFTTPWLRVGHPPFIFDERGFR